MSLRANLTAGLASMQVCVDSRQIDRLLAYIQELAAWGRVYNLTAVRDPAEMVTRHLLDSLSILPWLQGDRILDVGAGAGLPGIPLAIVEPERRYTLLDSNGKKIRFMRHAIRTLGIDGVTAQQMRVEAYRPEVGPACIVARAFAAPTVLLDKVAHICRAGTRVLAMIGKYEVKDEMLTGLAFRLLECPALAVPGCVGQRHLLVFEKI